METWNFRLELNRALTDDEFDALYEAGLSDASIIEDGQLDVDREAPTLLDAVTSAVAQIRTVPGLFAVALLKDDPVTLSDAAQRLRGQRTAESLRLLAEGKRGPGGFPPPVVDTGHIRIYSWAQITAFLARLGDDVPQIDPDWVLADRALRLHTAAAQAGPDRVKAVERLIAAA